MLPASSEPIPKFGCVFSVWEDGTHLSHGSLLTLAYLHKDVKLHLCSVMVCTALYFSFFSAFISEH